MIPTPPIVPRNAHSHIPRPVPLAGNTIALLVTLTATSLLSIFLFVLLVYIDSYLFVVSSSILEQVFGVSSSQDTCQAAVLTCLISYVLTKILIYVFLVEKAHLVKGSRARRRDSKLYLFNIISLLVGYFIVAVMNFYYRFARLENGECYIGMERISMIPLVAFDFVINIYLTILFLLPLTNSYSYKNQSEGNGRSRLRSVAFRTFVGACCTLTSSVVNLTVIMVLKGEPGWVCFMCCNADVLFSAIVLQWVTSQDSNSGSTKASSFPSSGGTYGKGSGFRMGSLQTADTVSHEDELELVASPNFSSNIGKSHSTGSAPVTTRIYSPGGFTDDRRIGQTNYTIADTSSCRGY
ncbi:hypothetical protein FIE12Z_12763 [Fusarium flagelliforme]|uniref:Uncharacterized protein n=1 Tax=Fusarium flagelliforme TaxID=2675880 RepID=A0A395M7G2_9HYPO|nr:hypothetical protein FIE12Z_12763 [Fusarium flagelliforme]